MWSPAEQIVDTARCMAAWPLATAIAGDAVLKGADALFEYRVGGIRQARVHVPGALDVEQAHREIAVREHERRRLVDGGRARTGSSVRLLPSMQGKGIESGGAWTPVFVVGHRRILTARASSRRLDCRAAPGCWFGVGQADQRAVRLRPTRREADATHIVGATARPSGRRSTVVAKRATTTRPQGRAVAPTAI